MPRRVGLIVLVALAGLALPLAAPAAPTDDPNARILRVERWLKAVLSHQPGRKDDAVSEVAAWSNADLRTLGDDERVLVELMRNPAVKQLKAAIPTRRGRPLVDLYPLAAAQAPRSELRSRRPGLLDATAGISTRRTKSMPA